MRQTGTKAQRAVGRRKPVRSIADQADIGGILRLLRAVHSSIVLHFGDEPAAELLEECIAQVAAHDPTAVQSDSSENQRPAELNMTALVRMLVYVQSEIDQTLGDAQTGRLLRRCIDHLLRQKYLYQLNDRGGPAATSH